MTIQEKAKLEVGVAKAVEQLFRNGQGDYANRLVIELPGGVDGGGWCRQAVADVIRRAIRENL
jgi:hypothetical protein